MSETTMRMMTLEQFAELATVAGFAGLAEDLPELVSHGVLVPLEQQDGEQRFYALQLVTLARYARKAHVWVHAWSASVPASSSTEWLAEQSSNMSRHIELLQKPSARPPAVSDLRALIDELEDELAEINPFGELEHLVALLSRATLDSMRGDARLFAEIRAGLEVLRAQTDALDSMRVTQDMPAPAELLASSAPTSPHIKTPELKMGDKTRELAGLPVSSPRVTAEMDALESPLPVIEPEDEPAVLAKQTDESAAKSEPVSPPPALPAQTSTPEPAEEDEAPESAVAPSEPEEESTGQEQEERGDDEPAKINPFVRDPSQSTNNTQDLQKRLEALRHLDGRAAAASPGKGSLAQKAIALSKAKQAEQEEQQEDQAEEVPEIQEEEPAQQAQQVEEIAPIEELEDVVELEEISEIEVPGDEEISIELSQESPLVLDDDEMEDFFEDSKTMVLDSNEIKSQARADASHAGGAAASEPRLSPEEEAEWQRQIQELNAKREAYMKEQNWSGLVALYENGVELFEGPERQQVYLTLGKLYELKIKDTARALENMALAFEMGGDETLLRKIIDALRRLGNGPTRPALMAWVEAQLGSGQWSLSITEALQRMRAGLLQETGDAQRGFLMYASFVADSPEHAATDSGLDFLESLAEGVDAAELYELYDELIEQTLDRTMLYHLNSRAGFFALQREDMDRAVLHLEQALELDPAQEQLFHVLSHVYEEGEDTSGLIVLYERRMRAVTGAAKEPLAQRLEQLRQQERAQSEKSREDYAARLERSPQDDVLLECMMRSFLEQEKYIEGYAFLNRHLENLTAVASRVRALQTLSTLALQHLESPEEAQVHLEEALKLGGARKTLLERLIMISLDMEEWSKVLLYIERLTGELSDEMDEDEQVRWLLAGVQAAQSLELVDKEKEFLERTLSIKPEHEQARQALADLG